jgi:hypothetical protein
MTMVYLANVPALDTGTSTMFYTPYNHVEVVYPQPDDPRYWVFSLFGVEHTRSFARFDQAMDFASRLLKQSEA